MTKRYEIVKLGSIDRNNKILPIESLHMGFDEEGEAKSFIEAKKKEEAYANAILSILDYGTAHHKDDAKGNFTYISYPHYELIKKSAGS